MVSEAGASGGAGGARERLLRSILILGGGSAGLIAAASLRHTLPGVAVRLVRSKEIGVIGVGEGTVPNFVKHLFDLLGISRERFYKEAEPTWKLGARFLWGPRGKFYYTFSNQLDAQYGDFPRPHGYYCDEDFRDVDLASALVERGKAFPRKPNGFMQMMGWHAFHIENEKLVNFLEGFCREKGVEFIEGTMREVERGPNGVAALILEDGRRLEADLYIDSSGFRSELLGRALETPYVSFGDTLFCDRAVVGGWERTDEPILPYTTAETMEAGWSWQIEHEHHVNRGYVFSSRHMSDEQAVEEFCGKNSKAPKTPRIVKFRSGYYRDLWVDNVVGIGNAAGFVEPLEATALMAVCIECQQLVSFLRHFEWGTITPSARKLFNVRMRRLWEDIRDFLALHYRFNTLRDTPFWRQCQNETGLGELTEMVEFYRENGPTGFARYRMQEPESGWGVDGPLVMLVGNRVPYRFRHTPAAAERAEWDRRRAGYVHTALQGVDVREGLAHIRDPRWEWPTVKQAGVGEFRPRGQWGV